MAEEREPTCEEVRQHILKCPKCQKECEELGKILLLADEEDPGA